MLKEAGFRRLASRGWTRPHGDSHVIVAIQCRQGGWDPRAGSKFVVELEQSKTPEIGTGYNRDRLWKFLDTPQRRRAMEINDSVALTLPEPDRTFLALLPESTQLHYLEDFQVTPVDQLSASDVWFHYYDESDAEQWGQFLADNLTRALELLLERAPTWFARAADSEED